jgi:hypothetical protein
MSGDTVQIQGKTTSAVPSRIAVVTDSITLSLTIEKCVSATSE